MKEIAKDKTDNINKIFSIQCTLKKYYEIFNKVRKLIKQEKEEKIKNLCKELQLIDPDMEIIYKKTETKEHNDNKQFVLQTQEHQKKTKTTHQETTTEIP